MFATIRRYDGVDVSRITELTSKVNETLLPQLRDLPGFASYYLIDSGDGVVSSVSLFETREQGDESTALVKKWNASEKLEDAIPNAPKITSGKVVTHSEERVAVG